MMTRLCLFGAACAIFLSSCVTLTQRKGASLDLDENVRARCVAILQGGLHDKEFWPAIHAAEGLTIGGHGDEVIAHLTPLLSTGLDDQQKCGVSRELVRAGDRAKAKIMLDILAGDDDFGHTHAAESLYKVGIIGEGVAMRKRFNDENADIKTRLMAAAALGKKGKPKAMKFIRENLEAEDKGTYQIAAWILARIGSERDIEPLRARLGDSGDPIVDAYIVNALATLGDPAGLAALEKNLSSRDPAIRTYAAVFAGDARAVSLAPKLQQLLDDPNADTRYRAAQSLLDLAR